MRSHVIAEAIADIGRPLDVVRGQFLDIDHHATHAVHPWVSLSEIKMSPDGCSYVQTIRTFGRDRVNRIWHFRQGKLVVSHYVEGPDAGIVTEFAFEHLQPDLTRVTSRTTIPLPAFLFLMRPFVAKAAKDGAVRALGEDKHDLEEGAYARRLATES